MATSVSRIGSLAPNLSAVLAKPKTPAAARVQATPAKTAVFPMRRTLAPATKPAASAVATAQAELNSLYDREQAQAGADQAGTLDAQQRLAHLAVQRSRLTAVHRAKVLAIGVPIVATLALILGRKDGMLGTLAALSGGLSGLRAGMEEKYKQGVQQFQATTKAFTDQAAAMEKAYTAALKNENTTLTQKADLAEHLTANVNDRTKAGAAAQERLQAARISAGADVMRANIEAAARIQVANAKMHAVRKAAGAASNVHALVARMEAPATAAEIAQAKRLLPHSTELERGQLIRLAHVGSAVKGTKPDLELTIAHLRSKNLLSPSGIRSQLERAEKAADARIGAVAPGTDAFGMPTNPVQAQALATRSEQAGQAVLQYGFAGILSPTAMTEMATQYALNGELPTSKYQSRFTAAQYHNLNEAVIAGAAALLHNAGLSGEDIGEFRGWYEADRAALTEQMRTGTLLQRNTDDLRRNFALLKSIVRKAGLGPNPPADAVELWLRRNAGSTVVAQLQAIITPTQRELSRVLSLSTSAGGSTDASQAESRKILSINYTAPQLIGSMAVLERAAANVDAAIRDQINARTQALSFKGMADAAKRANASGSGGGSGSPAVGTVEGGYRFEGGNPSNPTNWKKVR